MKIGVTGASGFLGKHLCERLEILGHSVSRFDSKNLDIRKTVELPSLDVLYHLAANSKMYLARREPLEDFKVNALGTLNVLEAMRKACIPKIIYASSVLVHNENEPYGLSKLIGERYIKLYSDIFDLKYVIFRISQPYGPGMKKGLVNDMIKGFRDGSIELYVDEKSELDLIYVADVIDAMARSLEWNAEVLDLCYGKPVTINAVYDILKNIFHKDVPIKYIEDNAVTINCDTTRLQSLGWKPKYNLNDGLKCTAQPLER